jgi:uncharacterized phage protein gp47/JayE
MPFNRPTPEQILRRIQAEIDILLPNGDPRLRYSVENVIARVVTLSSYELHGYIQWISKQILVDTAETEILERHAGMWGLARKGATAAIGTVSFTGTNGAVIPAGTTLIRSDNTEYVSTADATIQAGTADVPVMASVKGVTGNTEAGITLSFSSPVPGVNSDGAVTAFGITAGTNQEDDYSLRVRTLERIQQPPQGGAEHDYVAWSKAISGVTRVWVHPMQLGVGTVSVTFAMDNKVDTIIPSEDEVGLVQAALNSQRPTTATVYVFAPEAVSVDLEINIFPNTVAVRESIQTEIEAFFKREAAPGGTLYISRLREVISFAAGEFRHELILPAADITMEYGDLATVGNITWGDL